MSRFQINIEIYMCLTIMILLILQMVCRDNSIYFYNKAIKWSCVYWVCALTDNCLYSWIYWKENILMFFLFFFKHQLSSFCESVPASDFCSSLTGVDNKRCCFWFQNKTNKKNQKNAFWDWSGWDRGSPVSNLPADFLHISKLWSIHVVLYGYDVFAYELGLYLLSVF